jgi:hypothetical protein
MNERPLDYEPLPPAGGAYRNDGLIALLLSVASVLSGCAALVLFSLAHTDVPIAEIAASVTCLLSLVLSFVFSGFALRERSKSRAMGVLALTIASVWSLVLFLLLFG